jgi:uncharacterized protein (TIGR01777 family)
MKIVIAGGSGFIGQSLTEMLISAGHEITILTRGAYRQTGKITYINWLKPNSHPENEIGMADCVINLAGVSINDGRWTDKHKREIYASRMAATEELVRIIAAMPEKPAVLVNASAIGLYPSSLTTIYSESSTEIAGDFLGKTVHDWEKVASRVADFGVRTVFMRFGVVLGKGGGALPLMALPYKLFAGGTVGSGKQWVSWVHVKDVVRSIRYVMENEQINGPVNVVSPNPVRMKDFGRIIASVLHRPHWLPVPVFLMKLALGEKSALVLEGQHVQPDKLLKNGFEFDYSTLESALLDLLS